MVKPSRPMTPGDQIAELRTRVDKLERKPEAKPARGAVDLAGLKDVRLLYRNPVEAPKDGQVFRWVEDLTIPVYKGYWAPGGGAFIEWTGSDRRLRHRHHADLLGDRPRPASDHP